MKTNITICIDTELAQLLKLEKNKSALINSYLKDFYSDFFKKAREQVEQEKANGAS